jgi:hypothetical protein
MSIIAIVLQSETISNFTDQSSQNIIYESGDLVEITSNKGLNHDFK